MNPADWVHTIRRSSVGQKVCVVIGFVAAAAICVRLFNGNAVEAIYGGVAVAAGAVLVYVIDAIRQNESKRQIGIAAFVVLWICVVIFMFVGGMGVASLYRTLFAARTEFIDGGPGRTDDDLVWGEYQRSRTLIDDFNAELAKPRGSGTANFSEVVEKANRILDAVSDIPDKNLTSLTFVMKYDTVATVCAVVVNCYVSEAIDRSKGDTIQLASCREELMAAAQRGSEAVRNVLGEKTNPRDQFLRQDGRGVVEGAQLLEFIGLYKIEFMAVAVLVGESENVAAVQTELNHEKKAFPSFWEGGRELESPILGIVCGAGNDSAIK